MNDTGIPPALVRMPPWTFTMLNCYRNICPHQAAERYVYKRIKFVTTPAIEHGNRGHEAMERRVGRGVPLPDDLAKHEPIAKALDGRKVHVEMKLGVRDNGRPADFWDNTVWGRGKVDVAVVEGEQAYIADYKFGKVREDPFELEVGAVLLHAKFPHLKTIVGRYIWMAENRLGQKHDLTNTRKTWDEIGIIVGKMLVDLSKARWEKREGPLCRWCPVLDCENNRSQQ